MRRTVRWMTAALVLGLLAAPTSAEAGPTTAPPTVSKVDTKPEWGSLSARNGVLKKGCRRYSYHYEVTGTAAEGDWDIDVSVVGPGGKTLWLAYMYAGANPASGTATYRMCRSETRAGRYKLKAVVSVQDFNDNEKGRLPTAKFRLRNPR